MCLPSASSASGCGRHGRVELLQPAYRSVRVSVGVGARAGHPGTHFSSLTSKAVNSSVPPSAHNPRLSHPLPRPAPRAETPYCNWPALPSLRLHSQCLESWGRLARPIGALAAAGGGSGPPGGGAGGGAPAQD